MGVSPFTIPIHETHSNDFFSGYLTEAATIRNEDICSVFKCHKQWASKRCCYQFMKTKLIRGTLKYS